MNLEKQQTTGGQGPGTAGEPAATAAQVWAPSQRDASITQRP